MEAFSDMMDKIFPMITTNWQMTGQCILQELIKVLLEL
jgi:hypothetical protein